MSLDIIYTYALPIILIYTSIVVFYNAFKATWPELYFSISDYTSLFISVTPKRYLAFRIVPIIIISSMILAVFFPHFSSKETILICGSAAFVHSILTNGVALLKIFRRSPDIHTYFNTYMQVLVHLGTIVLALFAGFLGGLFAKSEIIKAVIPSPQGLVDNLWSALITAIFIVFFYKIYKSQEISNEQIFDKSLKNIDPNLREYIEIESANNSTDSKLILAICIVENIERPKWFRKFEKAKSFLFTKGSYGIMQLQSDKYLNDKQSIKGAIEKFFKYKKVYDYESFESLMKSYNPDSKYVELVFEAYRFLEPSMW